MTIMPHFHHANHCTKQTVTLFSHLGISVHFMNLLGTLLEILLDTLLDATSEILLEALLQVLEKYVEGPVRCHIGDLVQPYKEP